MSKSLVKVWLTGSRRLFPNKHTHLLSGRAYLRLTGHNSDGLGWSGGREAELEARASPCGDWRYGMQAPSAHDKGRRCQRLFMSKHPPWLGHCERLSSCGGRTSRCVCVCGEGWGMCVAKLCF